MALAYDKSLRTFDADGRMRVEVCNISKANVCPYFGAEIPGAEELGLDPNRIYQLYRDPGELYAAADSFRNLPILMTHVPVSAEAPRQELVVGTIGSDVRFEAPFLKASICVWTAEAISLIERGIQEQLSSAYRYVADMTSGVSPDGVPYDGVMLSLQGNHVALVSRGRAGPDVIVADSTPFQVLKTVKYSKFITALCAVLGIQIKPEQQVALDEAMKDDEVAEDCGLSDEEKKAASDEAMKTLGKDSLTDEETKAAYKKAAQDKRAKDSVPAIKPEGASDAAPAAVAAPVGITQDQLNAAVAAAIAQTESKAASLAAARDAVKPHVGAVALDSADAVYAFALGKLGVALDGIPAAAYPALLAAVVKTIPGKPVPTNAAPDVLSKATQFLGNISR